MKIQHLLEGTEPKLPGAPKGIQIMTPQQFVAKAGDMPGEEEVDEGYPKHQDLSGVSTDKLKAYLAKQSQQSVPGEGSQVKRVRAELQRRSQGVAEGYQFKGPFPFDVDHMPGAVHRDGDRTTDNVKSNNKRDWDRAVNSINARVFDDNADYSTTSAGTTVDHNGVVFALWSNKDNAGWFNVKGRKLQPNKLGEQGVAEGKGPLGQGNLSLALDTLKGSWNGWNQVKSTDPDIEVYDYDDGEGGYEATGTIQHNLNTGEITIDYSGGYGEEPVEGTFHSIGDAMNALRGGYPGRHGGKAPKHDTLASKTLAGPDDLYKTDRAGKKGTLSKARMDGMKASSKYTMRGGPQGVLPEADEHLARIRKLSGLDEATKLPAQSREFGGDEFQDYMKRIVGTPDVDKAGNVKTDKKGNEKYVSGKTKSDRYKMPYIHRSSVVSYLSPDGKTYDEDAVKKTLAIRPKALLKQNEKMKHSNGEFEQFFNVGFAALTGIALDEQTNKLIIVNTCPGAGACKVDCFAMKGGKVQFQGPWQSDGRILTYLLNDPDGFFNQLSAEITKESEAGKKGDKKFPNGWQTTVRWHDAGDFFSPEYLDMALKMAAKHPDVKFYAYTKMAGAALAKKPDNFIINWSEGAHTSQEKQVKASDANLDTTKNSRIVPDELFQDLLVKDEKKNLVKGSSGQWQVQPDKLPELKQRLASEYGLRANSILSYDEYMAKRKSIPQGMKYNVIVAPGEGDISANDQNIISTLLLRH
jgi:hypothetical protein